VPIETEKKYRLTDEQRSVVEDRLRALGASPRPIEFEENTLYQGGRIDFGGCALRLRRVNGRALLTFKQRLPGDSPIKHQLENECEIGDADKMDAILRALGFQPGLVYEKRRTRWQVGDAKVVIDELPFGLFMEIEADENEINRVEELLQVKDLPAVAETYPRLTIEHGTERGEIIEARFKK
jgi:adenylate cyclase, class 2